MVNHYQANYEEAKKFYDQAILSDKKNFQALYAQSQIII
jgi:hypothetical protein